MTTLRVSGSRPVGSLSFDWIVMAFRDVCDELRTHSTEWLCAHRDELVVEERRIQHRRRAVTLVLDERRALDQQTAARDGVTQRAVDAEVQIAKALEALPEVAAVAERGGLSEVQLTQVVQLADPASDREWAARAPNISLGDLQRLVRQRTKPTVDDARRRREARHLSWSWDRAHGMLHLRGALPDVDGAQFEAVMNHVVDRMRPPKGRPWERRDRRAADALVELCQRFGHDESGHPGRLPVLMVVEVPTEGPAEVAGVPLPDAMVEKLRASAKVEPHLIDTDGAHCATGRIGGSGITAKTRRAVLLRDGHCRWPGCTRRTGLEVHHLLPRSWGGGDDLANLVAVCTGVVTLHHEQLVPHGPYELVGNPNQPDGIRLEHHRPAARAGPGP